MIAIEQYKPFHNSQDFERIFKKSFKTLREQHTNIENFCKTILKKAIDAKNIYILYYKDLPAGYAIFSINQKKAFWQFDYIIDQRQCRKYARIFRSTILYEISKKADSLKFLILTENKKSLNSMLKLPKYTKIEIKKEETSFNKRKGFFYEIDLKQLDNLKQLNDSNTYETRTCLHFGTFAPEFSRAGI
jgi:hypothetical protein|tara:strand:- start:565 stop:1131 length:567 start_codon:yes stop_codon:yes gene_type:complete